MKNLTYKELLVIVFAIVIFYFVFFRKNNEKRFAQLSESEKVIKGFSESEFKKMIAKKYRSGKEYLKSKGLTSSDLLNLAKEIYDAKGLVDDDEQIVYSIFSKLPSIAVYSMLALAFKIRYKKDLQLYLASFLSQKELNNLYFIIKNKPKL